ncbi:MAG TPA: TetR family transcriptional regulator [Steroidobacteraceae bacterium]
MKSRQNPLISARKSPRQARSERLVATILEAASRVLAQEGAQRFTTARVAERAGVSVGSLYQYFPNKEAILFRLQTDEWRQTAALLDGILTDETMPPFERLRAVVRAFFHSECEEAELRVALSDAAPLYRDAPETRAQREAGKRQSLKFMREMLPTVPSRERIFAMDLVMTAMSALGKKVSEQGYSRATVDRWATATGDMFCAYLERLTSDDKLVS